MFWSEIQTPWARRSSKCGMFQFFSQVKKRQKRSLCIQYLPEKWYKFHYFDTALFWSYEGQSHEVNIATQSYFQRSFWWAFKKYGICNHLRENWEPLKKWVHFPWTLRLLEPFQVDFRQKPFLIRFSTFIWPGYHEIILKFD